MRTIDKIIIHCSATRENMHFTVKEIDSWHRDRGFAMIGYHYVIYLDGTVHDGRPLEAMGAHTLGQNKTSIGICYIGGVAIDGKTPKDTRTQAQKEAMQALVARLVAKYPKVKEIKGHRDYSPDLNGDGKIDSWEWMKACPSFDVSKEYKI